ncbi:cytochrome c maturation protein CcmE [Aristophania vespae]|uniref:Cytochrome c-type biogenesis protein CcmE n=1 Tax=Aristophania vespae TaxID=2697033 RepID=A0A6P1NDG7_9PROT|nr:cytochrome c maturation protein CcmE [Aristophania vespae]QHI96346.1 cytochrome c maturation protein CcmE [Aristophania vespae]
MSRKMKRLWIVIICVICLAAAAFLMLRAFSSSIMFFMAPSQVREHPPSLTKHFRLGGMVVAGSFQTKTSDHHPIAIFDVTDGQAAVTVHYSGILPDLFREGQSVVALGHMDKDGYFLADTVLAKHDETYMPKEVADALKKSGKWDPRFGPPPDAASWDKMTASKAAQTHQDNP